MKPGPRISDGYLFEKENEMLQPTTILIVQWWRYPEPIPTEHLNKFAVYHTRDKVHDDDKNDNSYPSTDGPFESHSLPSLHWLMNLLLRTITL